MARASTLKSLLSTALPFLSGDLHSIDPRIPELISALQTNGAGLCWHKHGSFLSHLLGVHRVLSLWGVPEAVALCGLFHSAYSNSYVNLAIFDSSTSRDHVRSLVGVAAERLIYLFCVISRQKLIHEDLLPGYLDDVEIQEQLRQSESSLRNLRDKGTSDPNEPWRKKLNTFLPPGGLVLKHIKTGEDVKVSRRTIALFLVMTLADLADQWFSWMDALFENHNGQFEFKGSQPNVLWPGSVKPGLWVTNFSRIGALYSLIAREEEIYQHDASVGDSPPNDGDDEIELVIPPVLDSCSRVLDPERQVLARDLYWEAVNNEGGSLRTAEEKLVESIAKNPYVGEPHLVLSQVYLSQGRYEDAEVEAERGVRLMLEWGCCWDKRIEWDGWVSWGRVLLSKAKERHWPNHGWGIINLGLVK